MDLTIHQLRAVTSRPLEIPAPESRTANMAYSSGGKWWTSTSVVKNPMPAAATVPPNTVTTFLAIPRRTTSATAAGRAAVRSWSFPRDTSASARNADGGVLGFMLRDQTTRRRFQEVSRAYRPLRLLAT